MFIPPLLRKVCLFLELRESHARHLWGALLNSHWQRPQAWKRELARLEGQHTPLAEVMCDEALAPAVLVRVVEDLGHERRLSKLSELLITEAILRQVDADGHWVGIHPRPGGQWC